MHTPPPASTLLTLASDIKSKWSSKRTPTHGRHGPRGDGAVPGAGPRRAVHAAGAPPPCWRRPSHLRPHAVQLPPPPPRQGRGRRAFLPRLHRRGHRRRPLPLRAAGPQHDVAALVDAVGRNCLGPFRTLLTRLAPVTCVVADTVMTFAATAAREAGVPDVAFFTASACGLMGYLQYGELIKRGLVPLKDASCLTTPLDWVPGMSRMRLKDMPTFCHTTDTDDAMVAVKLEQVKRAVASKAIIINSFYELEKDVVDALAAIFPPVYTVGPLAQVLASTTSSSFVTDMDISIWQEDARCLAWLDGKKADNSSVVYFNMGSVAVMTGAQTREFALGLATCGFPFLWVKRPDVVDGGEELDLPEKFLDEVARGAGLVVPWCPQAAVLKHATVGLFVTHCGWNSLLEAAVAGVPVLGWPVLAEQTTNCRQVCECWCNGAELPREVEHGAVAGLVREMMEGELGKEKRAKAAEWKAAAEAATAKGGTSRCSLQRLVHDVLQLRRNH